ncbi:pentapeptide repeat-containing protein [Kitasatospora sp. NPDC090091]|uniref:pentapeptide repeat-containing protein n=1 Tax=Kitasatospora sp. NPDC090091 TaxID=3364081 RepID=UPI0038123793
MSTPTQDFSGLWNANDKIRSAAKWIVASSAAVGAALLAGSQLSNIGKLPPSEGRFWWAVVGAVIGLIAVVCAIWLATRILLPLTVTIDQLVRQWDHPKRDLKPAVDFFKYDTTYLQHYGSSPQGLKQAQADNETALQDAGARGDQAAKDTGMETRLTLAATVLGLEQLAQHKVLEGRFRRNLRWLMLTTGLAAAGILAFAWASNPPAAQPPAADLKNAILAHANLRDADLKNAVLDHADFTCADLTGADLKHASLVGAKWHDTTCPDGKNSDKVGGSCAGHLTAEGDAEE